MERSPERAAVASLWLNVLNTCYCRMRESSWVGINQPPSHLSNSATLLNQKLTFKSSPNKSHWFIDSWKLLKGSHQSRAGWDQFALNFPVFKLQLWSFLASLFPSLSPLVSSPHLARDSHSSRIRLAIIYSRPGRLWRADSIRWRDNGALW